MKKLILIFIVFIWQLSCGQNIIGNYVSNGSFEALNSYSSTSYVNVIEYWQPIDTNKFATYLATAIPPIANIPYLQGYQFARTGKNYLGATFLCYTCLPSNSRSYPRNRLKRPLKANTTYCVKFYLNSPNNIALGTDSYAVYFGDSNMDTIINCTQALTYLNPQIQNIPGNIVSDTLHWTPITGTFIATGSEKYMVLGNFKSDAGTNTVLINPGAPVTTGIDICIDDVSVIEMNLPAYAGRDTMVTPGTPVFIGREPDFAIDSGCTWYQLPNMTAPIYDKAGLWVNPIVTTTYVVRQILECSPEKWDTVVIYMTPVGTEKWRLVNEELKIFPVPASNRLELRAQNSSLVSDFNKLTIYDQLGQLVREEEIRFVDGRLEIDSNNLAEGLYSLQLSHEGQEAVSKRFLIKR